jgi:hypothetical protein
VEPPDPQGCCQTEEDLGSEEIEGCVMLRDLIEEGQKAESMPSRLHHLMEVAAYVMQTGPRGGRFYYDDAGRRHYGDLPAGRGRGRAAAAPSAPSRPRSREEYDRMWQNASGFPSGTNTASVGQALRNLFGDRAPTPEEFAGMFSELGIKAKITQCSGYGSAISVSYDVLDEDGEKIGHMQRDFRQDYSGRGPEVHHSYFALNEDAQAGGRCGAMFGKALKTYKKMGVAVATVDAAITVGPYAWARFGFQPSAGEMRRIKSEFTDFLTQPPIGLSPTAAAEVVRQNGENLHSLSGTRVQVRHLNPKTGQPETKTIKAGKDFLLYSRQGGTRSWSGTADLRDPKVVARWEAQAEKGTKVRKKAIAEGTQNARDASPKAVAAELRSMGDGGLARLVDAANVGGRLSRQSPDAWNHAMNALKKASRDNPDKKGKLDSMIERMEPFYQRVLTREGYTLEGRRKFRAEQERARRKAAEQGRPAQPTRAAPAAPRAPPAPAAATPSPVPAESPGKAGQEAIFQDRARRFGTTVDQEREVERIAGRRIRAEITRRQENQRQAMRRGESPPNYRVSLVNFARNARSDARSDVLWIARGRTGGGAGVSPADQAAAQARVAQRRADRRQAQTTPAPSQQKRPRPASPPAVSPQARDMIRQGQQQVRAATTPEPATPEARAKKYGTTAAQERRIAQKVDMLKQRELLRRRDARGQAQAVGAPVPEFIPIRKWEQQKRALERARIRR